MKYDIDGKKYLGKITNNETIFYFLNDKIVKCSWKHKVKPFMISNDDHFLQTTGFTIYNNRQDKDIASVSDNFFSGI